MKSSALQPGLKVAYSRNKLSTSYATLERARVLDVGLWTYASRRTGNLIKDPYATKPSRGDAWKSMVGYPVLTAHRSRSRDEQLDPWDDRFADLKPGDEIPAGLEIQLVNASTLHPAETIAELEEQRKLRQEREQEARARREQESERAAVAVKAIRRHTGITGRWFASQAEFSLDGIERIADLLEAGAAAQAKLAELEG